MQLFNLSKKILIFALVVGTLTVLVPTLTVSAQSPSISTVAAVSKQAACSGLRQVDGTTQNDCGNLEESGGGVGRILAAVTRVLSIIVGAVAIIMIIYSGLKFMTASGDTNKVASAKTTLIYALIGVAIAVLANFLVEFVFTQTTNAT
jgi:hypothetical protein